MSGLHLSEDCSTVYAANNDVAGDNGRETVAIMWFST